MNPALFESKTPVNFDVLFAENQSLNDQVATLSEHVASLKDQLDWFKRQLFGVKSEKRIIDESGVQMDWLSGLSKALPDSAQPDKETITYARSKRRKENTVTDSGLRFDDSVPIQTIVLPPPELDGVSAADQIQIGEKISYRLAQRPGSYVVLKFIRPVIKRRDHEQIMRAPTPDHVLERSIADVSLLAGMLVDKFVYHLPLYRQHQRLAQSGIELSRMTLTNLSGRAIDLLEPIYDAQWAHVLRSRVLSMDETPIKSGRKGPGKMKQGYFWPVYGEADEVVFCYRPTRAACHVEAILGEDFKGVLVSDGYQAYARYASHRPGVCHAQCWSHTRRTFERAKDIEPQAVTQALEIIGTLYRHEQQLRDGMLTGEAKQRYRTEHSKPIVDQFWRWCHRQCQRPDLLPSNPLTRALKYALARTDALSVFLSDPDVPIDTNHLERSLRPIPMGRRNWLFCWTELGAKQVGIIQSLLVTCKLHGIDPYTYLVDVLQRISVHPASRVLELTPREWKDQFASNPMQSVLDANPS